MFLNICDATVVVLPYNKELKPAIQAAGVLNLYS